MRIQDKIEKELSAWIPFYEELKKGILWCIWIVSYKPKNTLMALSGLSLLWASLSFSDMLFFRFLGYGWGAEWNAWNFLQYAREALESPERSHWIFSLIAPLVAIGGGLIYLFNKEDKEIFGNARWASVFEMKKAHMLDKSGVFLGKYRGFTVCAGGEGNMLVVAPAGSGKTAGVIIPTLIRLTSIQERTQQESFVGFDPKDEMSRRTAGHLQKNGYKCFIWRPGERGEETGGKVFTHRYNPIDFVSRDKRLRIDDLEKIAAIMLPVRPEQAPIWVASSRELFVAIQLYLLDTPSRPKTLGEMVRFCKRPNFIEWLKNELKNRVDELDRVCVENLNDFANKDYRLQSNILTDFLSYFTIFSNPLLDASTSHSDFDFRLLRKEKMAIYVAVSSNNITRYGDLIAVFFQQVLDFLLMKEDINRETDPYLVRFVLEELSHLGAMKQVQKTTGLARSYGVSYLGVIQDIPQLYVTYGYEGAKAFINSKFRVIYALNDLDSAKLVSGWLGDTTVKQHSNSSQSGKMGGSQTQASTHRPLMSPDRIMKLNRNKIIVAIEGANPVLINKVMWFDDPVLKKCVDASKPIVVPCIDEMIDEILEKNNETVDDVDVILGGVKDEKAQINVLDV